MSYRSYRVFSTLALLLSLPLAGCSKDPEVAKREYLRSGDEYAAQKKFREAIIEYRNAVQQDPRFGEARLKLGDSYLQVGDVSGAYQEYVRAADLLTDSVEAQLKAGNLLLIAQQFEDAQARAERALALEPLNVDALIVRANALAGLNKIDQAVAEIEEAIRNAPDRPAGYANLGAMQMLKGDRDQAEAAFKKAVEADPQSIQVRLGLANFYWSVGRAADAERELRAALVIDPRDALVNRSLAYFHIGSGRAADAEPHLKVVAEVTPDASGKLALADYYVSQGRSTEARPLLEGINATDGETYVTAKLRIALLDLDSGDQASASSLVDSVLAKQPSHPEGLMIKAQMLLSAGKSDEALAVAQSAAKADSRSAPVQLVLGKVRLARNEPEEAIGAFSEALKLNPKLAAAEIELARVYLATGRLAEAERYARSVIEKLPGSTDGHLLLARVSLLKRDLQTAEASLKVLTTALPTSEAVQTEMGWLQLAKGDRAGARDSFEKVLSGMPGHYEALAAVTRIDVEDKRYDVATARLTAAIERAPRDARLLLLSGGVYAAAKDIAAQERVLRQAVQVDPNNPEVYGMLGSFYAIQGRLQEATGEFENLARKEPRSVPVQTVIALLLEAQNRTGDAQAQYEKVLSIDSRAPVAANNLAWLYVEGGGNLEVALQLAQTAKGQLPDVPEVDDTLGWIYHKKGFSALAVSSLQEAVRKNPANPSFHYHLGVIYAAAGDPDKARTALQKALSLNGSFAQAPETRQALAQLR